MRLGTVLMGLVVLHAACSGSAEPTTTTASPTTSSTSTTTTTTLPAEPPVWAGFEATNKEPQTLAAIAHGPLDVYETATSGEPVMTLEETTILGTTTVLGVVTEPEDGWAEVMLPVRPNGTTGWVRTNDVSFYVADSEIVVELTERRLTYIVDGVEVLQTEIAIGNDSAPTPTGHYFVTDSVTLADPNSPWGPHAFGLSARSDTITEFNGGDGIIGIHGTNNPDSIGNNVSLGCVRLPNDMITRLHAMVPIGVRVTVNA